ncbi:chromosome segregation protein SMC [Chromatium weissei]|nr:chromosome segregation protein SMC [Chromatium weissei]
MKILNLDLRAFGPFTDCHLDLSGGEHGLHIIFGANEAGKSSALRALRALLFGIPERCQDNFRHTNPNLRIGGRFRSASGQELHCFRKKGRKQTLRDEHDAPLADDALAQLLGGVDERMFERLFGIDHDNLVSGGLALLAERGREAEALFGAGLGGGNVHTVLKRLDQEALELFSPRRGSNNRLINQQLNQFAELERRQHEILLLAQSWDNTRRAVEQARTQLLELDAALTEASRQRSRLERIRRTQPNLARHAQLLAQLSELRDLPQLSANFGQRRETAWSQRATAVASQASAQQRDQLLQQKIAAVTVHEDLLAEAELIDSLLERLGSHRKAALDRFRLVTDRNGFNAQAAALLAQTHPALTLTDAPSLRPLLNRRRRVTELGDHRGALAAALTQAQHQYAATTQQLERLRTAFTELPSAQPLDTLRHAVEAAHRAGDLDRAIAQAQKQQQRRDDDCQRELAALGLWTADLDALRRAPLPNASTIERFIKEFQALDDAQRSTESTHTEMRIEQRRIDEALRALQLVGAVPSEMELAQARHQRDQLLQQLKTLLLASESRSRSAVAISSEFSLSQLSAPSPMAVTKADKTALVERVELAVTEVDQVADRLRREAQRVHEQANAQARRESCTQQLNDLAQLLAAQQKQRELLTQAWLALWLASEVKSPLPPREMQSWLNRANRLCELATQADEQRAALTELTAESREHVLALATALEALDVPATFSTFRDILALAEMQLTARTETERRRMQLEREMTTLHAAQQQLELEVERCQTERNAWASEWSALMTELGLPANASPGDASDHLKTLNDCLLQLHEAERLAGRITGIDHDAAEFQRNANALLTRLAPDLLARPLPEAVVQLHQRLGKQREDRSRLNELLRQSHSTQAEIQQATATIQAADTLLAELCREARCAEATALVAVEQRVLTRRNLQQQLQDVEEALMAAGDGLGIDALRNEAAQVERDTVLAELTALELQINNALRPQQLRLLEEKVKAERQFAEMAGDAVAAQVAEEMQAVLATLRVQAERYVQLKLAGKILRDEIERFRRTHRDPILARASGYFAQLTCNAFHAVESSFDDVDQPILVGQRANGERLQVEGMSTGTRDQLYLALRLANLEHHLQGIEPLPFVVDDILIQFDDVRAQATLDALMTFSTKTQVILFTHHQQVITQAQLLDPQGRNVLVHTL